MLKTLDNSLNILTFFTKNKPSWGVRELAQKADISHTVVYRILKTFEKHGFLSQDETTERYEIGMRFLEFGDLAKSLFPLEKKIKSSMQVLCESVGECIFLTWHEGNNGLIMEYAEVQNSVKFSVELGSRTPIYAGANNKVIMAYLTDQEIDKVIDNGLIPITKETRVDPEQLKKELKDICIKGYAQTVGEYDKDVTGLAIPLFDKNDNIIASLTIAGPSYRIDEDKLSLFLPLLKKTGAVIQPYIKNFKAT